MTWLARTHNVTTGLKDLRGNPHATDSVLVMIVEGQLLGSQTDPGGALPDLVAVNVVIQVSRTNGVHTLATCVTQHHTITQES